MTQILIWKMKMERKIIMSNIFIYLFILFMVVLGGGSTIYVVSALPIVIIYKIHRRIKHGENIM